MGCSGTLFRRLHEGCRNAGADLGAAVGSTRRKTYVVRIAIVAHLKHPIAKPFCCGVEMHTHLLERQLAAAGHEVTLFAADGSTGRDVVTVCAPPSRLEPDPVLARTIDDVEQGAYVGIVSRLRAGAFEIVHCNALHPVPLLDAASLGLPTVCVLHTPPFAPYEAAVRSCGGNVTFAAVSRSLARQWSGMDIDPSSLTTASTSTASRSGARPTRTASRSGPDALPPRKASTSPSIRGDVVQIRDEEAAANVADAARRIDSVEIDADVEQTVSQLERDDRMRRLVVGNDLANRAAQLGHDLFSFGGPIGETGPA